MGATQEALTRQYRAALLMLEQAVEACPEALWRDESCPNRFWHVAYHALFFTHLYLHESDAVFGKWERHREGSHRLGKPEFEPYTKAEVREYLALIGRELEPRVNELDLAGAAGFHWLPFTRLEVHMYNLRHLSHHTGQLQDRLRNAGTEGAAWVRG
jgi:hypothetical protein